MGTATDLNLKYFYWLYDQVCHVRDAMSPDSYIRVCQIMHEVTFQAIVRRDQNRIGDVSQIREEFALRYQALGWSVEQTSILEVLVAFARRINFMTDWHPFMNFLDNLRLTGYPDMCYVPRDDTYVRAKLSKFNNRMYRPNGMGGLFPLREPSEDQRDVELWYQMAAYVDENKLY